MPPRLGPVQRKGLALVEVVRFMILTLQAWARSRDWGEITITVQGGQIITVKEYKTHRDRLPVGQTVAEPQRAQIEKIAASL